MKPIRALLACGLWLLSTACTGSPARTETRWGKPPFWYFEAGPRFVRFDLLKALHVERAADYSSFELLPFATRNTYRAASGEPRSYSQYGVNYILPLWTHEVAEARRSFRLIAVGGFDELSLFHREVSHEALDDGGLRDTTDHTVLWWVGDGIVTFRARRTHESETSTAGETFELDFGRMLWGWLFQCGEYRSTTPAPGTAGPTSRTLQLMRALNGYLILLRDHEIAGVESDLRFLGAFESDTPAVSIFRWRTRNDPASSDVATRGEFLGPFVRYESALDRSTLWVVPLFTFERSGRERTLRLFHLLPIPLGTTASADR